MEKSGSPSCEKNQLKQQINGKLRDCPISREMADFGGAIVQTDSEWRNEKNPPAQRASGNLSNPAGSETPGRDLVRSLRDAAQVCNYVATLMRIDSKIADGEEIDCCEDVRRSYAACWRIFEACADKSARRDFVAITGESWGRFTGALDALGFRLLPAEKREAFSICDISRDAVAGLVAAEVSAQ